MTAQLTKIRASDAQAIINFGFGQAPAIVTKNMKQLGIDLPLYQSHGVASKTFIDLAGAAAEGRAPAGGGPGRRRTIPRHRSPKTDFARL
jgi:branched-chain amino acid transport system substrate-binding protein